MKRSILFFLTLLILFQITSAQVVKEMNTSLDIISNDEVNMEITFRFPHTLGEVYFSIPHPINNLEVERGKCHVEEYVNNILVCESESPFIVGEIIVRVNFNTEGMITKKQNKTFFEMDIPILQETQEVNIVSKLPELMVLVDNELLPLSPSGADIGSDGRRIITKWGFGRQYKGDIIPLRIYYENLNPTNFIRLIDTKWLIIILLVIVVGIIMIYNKISKRSKVFLSVLNEAERIIVNIIQEQGGNDVDQRKLVRQSGFSKAKVSRILQSLEERGVISRVRVGRRKKVTLEKEFREE